MAKSKTVFRCQQCGFESPKWNGKCPSCGAWNSLVEETIQPAATKTPSSRKKADLSNFIQELQAVDTQEDIRYRTGIGELDRVLGGGLVKGSIVLLGGEPGIGKSTLLLQICEFFGASHSILYVSGEESTKQIKLRAERLHVTTESLYLLANNDAQSICDTIAACEPDIVIIDSIQTMYISGVDSPMGSPAQIRDCTSALVRFAKRTNISVMIVGHVTKEGNVAGPRMLEHMVDTVLYFEGDRHASYRILRAVKNRFGSTNEIGVFEMCNTGLEEVKNPSEYMLNGRPEDASGSVVACSMEGTRPILVEIQALVCQSNFGIPRRTAVGTDFNRVNLLMAVLEKKVGLRLAASDAYVNIAGGMKMTEPAIDLGICLAIVSSAKDIVIPDNVMVFGEVGLSGEIRAVNMAGQRVQEAKKLGFGTVVLPEVCRSSVGKVEGINLVYVSQIRDAIGYIMKK